MRRIIDRLFSNQRMGTASAIAAGLCALGLSISALALATALQDADVDQRVAVTTYPPQVAQVTRP